MNATLKSTLRRIVYSVPGARNLRMAMTDRPDFIGWGMVTHTHNPWDRGGPFFEATKRISSSVESRDFRLTQFEQEGNQQAMLTSLMWRHYVVHWTASFACQAVGDLVECGVCDGLTMYFALNATDRRAWLYDAWDPIRPDLLTAAEQGWAGHYDYLNVETTKKNLAEFADRCVFNKGYIPEIFPNVANPESVAWLHIDLNGSSPTVSALEYFYPRIKPGGVVLFDDYAHHGFEDTRHAVDEFFKGERGMLLPMPTGQAIYFVR